MFEKLKSWAACALLLLVGLAPACAYSAPKTVLVLGDSLSAEYGLARGTGWVALLERKARQDKLDAVFVNASISGETSSGGATRLPALLRQYHPALLIIELGANDGLRGLPVAAAERNFRAMIQAARKSGAKVMLVGMRMPPNYGKAYTDSFSAMYARLAKEYRLPFVPFLLEGVADKPELFQPDQLHPLAQAHPIILANLWPVFSQAIKTK